MRFEKTYVVPGSGWTTPFCKWQGKLSALHPLKLAAEMAHARMQALDLTAGDLAGLHLGVSVPQHQGFWGAPWVAAMMGHDQLTGPTISQACATSARVVASAASAVELGARGAQLALTADRISNGPHLYYPDPHGPGGRGVSEDWVWDNFNRDPYAGVSMVQTAENIARRFNISRQAQDDLTAQRYAQYQQSMAHDRQFQKRYMQAVTVSQGKRSQVVDSDEGITPVAVDRLATLKPVLDQGTVTYGTQTHPADGNAGLLLAQRDVAVKLSAEERMTVQLLSFAKGRAEKAHMGMAPVPAAQAALTDAGIGIQDLAAIKTHNPFVVNDLYFAQQTGVAAESMNNYGCSLIFGHPQAPTGLRLIIELIEELRLLGGGFGLFTGCAAGDTGAAVVLRVDMA